ncbi:MAG: D-2-hydroxyacid dehydrogenase [Acetobacteraceae bacterium]|nr:D-2-hydroxyacid dehydrogenase [Acetobacteraceae bacterium]
MPHAPRLLLWADATAPYESAIAEAGLTDRVRITALPRKETPSPELLAETEVILGWGAPAGVLPRMPKLRWIQSLTAGVEGWLALPDLPPGIALTCARGTHRASMPENILGAIFHIAKPYHAIEGDNREHRWTRRMAMPLGGKTLGILGLGEIGSELARKAAALDMRVIGTRRKIDTTVPGVAQILSPERTDELLAQSDFVVCLLPATPATDNFLDAARFAKMKPTAWLINFGRGAVIRDADLIAAVTEKRIAGAILDVFRQEPLPPSDPFWSTEGILVLPHIGGGFPGRDGIVGALFADNLARFLDGRPLRELVDRSAGY